MSEEQLIIVRPRQMGKMIELVKQLRPEVKIEESDCQKNLESLVKACEDLLFSLDSANFIDADEEIAAQLRAEDNLKAALAAAQ